MGLLVLFGPSYHHAHLTLVGHGYYDAFGTYSVTVTSLKHTRGIQLRAAAHRGEEPTVRHIVASDGGCLGHRQMCLTIRNYSSRVGSRC